MLYLLPPLYTQKGAQSEARRSRQEGRPALLERARSSEARFGIAFEALLLGPEPTLGLGGNGSYCYRVFFVHRESSAGPGRTKGHEKTSGPCPGLGCVWGGGSSPAG